jgi:hypothetical protein
MRTIVPAFAMLMGVGLFANGMFMLVDPANWYFAVPGVTTTGPFNQHFIRDIGMTFLFVGAAYAGGAAVRALRAGLWAAATLWLAGHAVFHLWEVATGLCAPSKLAIDFPGVFLPALLGGAMTLWAARPESPAIQA